MAAARAATLAAVSVWLVACGLPSGTTQVGSPSIPASTSPSAAATTSASGVDAILQAARHYSPNCEGSGITWKCWGHPSGNTYYGFNTYGSETVLHRVSATYSVFNPSSPDKVAAVTFFLDIAASLRYGGAEPTVAAEWIRTTWDEADQDTAKTEIGGAHLRLHLEEGDAGAAYSLVIVADDLSP
jgi:hypothetical protein